MLIAGDIGGTKTLLALFDHASGPRKPLATSELRSADYSGLAPMVGEFLAQRDAHADCACFDVAGPVVGGRARLTNLPWVLDEEGLRRDLGLRRVTLLNDLTAVAVSVPHLRPDELHTINPGTPEPHGPLAVVAPGTGLGEAFLVWDGQTYLPCASEGGHADFAPANELQDGLLRFMREHFGHVPYERVCSGSGLPNLYDFLRDAGRGHEPPGFAAELAEATDRTPLLVRAAVDDPAAHPLAAAAVALFVSILGAEAGNLALKVLATGGVYLAGGMPGRLIPQLEDGGFMDAFVAKGRFADRLATTPIQVITTRAALLGAAIYGLEHLDVADRAR
jgi:glucokinase